MGVSTYFNWVGIVSIFLGIATICLPTRQEVFALMRKAELSELKQSADAVVRAKVLTVRSEWNEDRTFIWTFVEVKVSRWIKNQGVEGKVVTIKTPGGTVGDITQVGSNDVAFNEKEDVILFLKKSALSYFKVVGMYQGKFTISDEKVVGKGVSVDSFIEEIIRN